jgi:hypothetical protein
VTRAEADAMVSEFMDAVIDRYGRRRWESKEEMDVQFHKMNAIRERLIDQLCGEERTEPMAGRQP